MADTKETKAQTPNLESMPIEERIKWFYEHGRGSIQDIARIHRLTVDEVLKIIGQDELTIVETTGDMVDQGEAGPGVQLEHGKQHYVNYTTD
jgi:hypothetical protein